MTVINENDKDIDNVVVSYPGFRFDVGILSPNVGATRVSIKGSAPETANIAWKTQDSVSHAKEISLRPTVTERYGGVVVFHISGDMMSVETKKTALVVATLQSDARGLR